jgi:hypothetical protein
MQRLSNRHLHERWKVWGWLRKVLRSRFYGFVKKTFRTDDGRGVVCDAAANLRVRRPKRLLEGSTFAAPYPELGAAQLADRPSDRSDVVIITGRFRSGSTLLWNLFRQAGGFTAYYEPLNERRWFDPNARGDRLDATHRGVSDYWREYDGLDVLGKYYDEDWTRRDLLMDEESWAPELKRYVDVLIDRAVGRPALQFNRIDFRLPWFRHHYPNARFVHIFRHPRDQWCSTLMQDVKCYSKDATMAAFPPFDKFYLRPWAEDLKYHFPFLDERCIDHPYQLYYFIWKLSYIVGRKYCDHSIQFEQLVISPESTVAELFDSLGADSIDAQALKRIIVAPALGRWRSYADDAWFSSHESYCESVIAEFLMRPLDGVSPLNPPASYDAGRDAREERRVVAQRRLASALRPENARPI